MIGLCSETRLLLLGTTYKKKYERGVSGREGKTRHTVNGKEKINA